MGRRWAGVVAVIAAGSAACAGSDATDTLPGITAAVSSTENVTDNASSEVSSTTTSSPDATTTAAPTTTSSTTSSTTVAVDQGEADVPRTFMVDALRSLPASVRNAAFIDDGMASVLVTLSSFDLIAQDANITSPADATNVDDAMDRLVEMTTELPVDRGGTGGAVFIPTAFPRPNAYREAADVERELGFSPFSIRSVAELVAAPFQFTVLSGDLPISADLAESSPGVFSTGDWPDGDLNMGDVSAARPLGQTVHLAQRPHGEADSLLGVTLHRPQLEQWVAGENPSLLDLPAYAESGAILDEARATSALIIEADFSMESLEADRGSAGAAFDEVRITEPFALVGIGSSTHEGRSTATVIYQFADQGSAERALGGVEEMWRDGNSIVSPPTRFADLFVVERVDQRHSAVVVTLGVPDDRSVRSVYRAFAQRDAVFLYR